MKRATLILMLIMGTVGQIAAQSADLPERSFLWNRFSSFQDADPYTVVTSDYGLAVLEYDSSTERYRQVGQLLTVNQPFTSKLSGNVLAVQTWANVVYLVDASDLPNLTLLGEADIAFPFYDFALKDQSLYIAAGFDGLLRYQLTSYADPVLVDSNLSGVHCVQVDIYDNEMLVLDDYNAIMRYDVSGAGFGTHIDNLWLPLQVRSFTRIDSTIVMPLNGRTGVYIGAYTSSGPRITETVELVFEPELAMAVDTHIVALSYEAALMQTLGRQSPTGILAALPRSALPALDGCALTRSDGNHLVLPSDDGGLWDFNLDNLWFEGLPREVYGHPGPVVDVHLDGDKLITGGRSNPFEVYSLQPDTWPSLDTTLYGLNDVGSIGRHGNDYLVHYPEANSVFVVRLENGMMETIAAIDVSPSSAAKEIQFYETSLTDSLNLMLVFGGGRIDVYGVSDTWEATLVSTAQAEEVILDAVVVDSFLVFSSADDQLHGYRFYSNLALYHWWTVSTPQTFTHLTVTGPRTAPDLSPLESLTLGFAGKGMYRIEIPPVDIPIVVLADTYPMEIEASTVFDNALYTVGDRGMGLLDLAYYPPQLVDQWGLWGNEISLDSNWIAITDGSAVHLYPMVPSEAGYLEPEQPLSPDGQLGQNYPNPFNPSTTIDFYLPEAAHVQISILNVLGQVVATLIDKTVSSGQHSVCWNGVDASGENVASGVYFYRLTTPDKVETRKMVVLK